MAIRESCLLTLFLVATSFASNPLLDDSEGLSSLDHPQTPHGLSYNLGYYSARSLIACDDVLSCRTVPDSAVVLSRNLSVATFFIMDSLGYETYYTGLAAEYALRRSCGLFSWFCLKIQRSDKVCHKMGCVSTAEGFRDAVRLKKEKSEPAAIFMQD